MNLTDFIEYGANFLFWSSAVFFLLIGLFWPWWKSFWGINLVSFDFFLGMAVMPFVLSYDFGIRIAGNAVYGWTVGTGLWLGGVTVLWRGWLIIAEQISKSLNMTPKQLIHSLLGRPPRPPWNIS